MTRWKRAAYVGLCSLALAFLSSCGQVQEAPQGITGIWQTTATDNASGRQMTDYVWIETTTGNNVIARTEADFLGGTFVGNHLTYQVREDAGTPNEFIVTCDADLSGTRWTNVRYVMRRVSDNAVLQSGTGEAVFVMHPADLKTNFNTAGPGAKDLSEGWWSNPVPDINVTFNGSRYVISSAPSNPTPLAIATWFKTKPHDDFLVRANLGGMLPGRAWSSTVEIERDGQMFWVKAAEKRVALIRITNASTGTYEYAYPYGNYAFSAGTQYLHRRRTEGGTERIVAFLEMKNPDTNTPVELARMNASTMEVESLPSSGDPVKIPFQGAPAAWRSDLYSGTSDPGVTLMAGLMADLAPSGGVLPTGMYRLRARDTQGYEYFEDAYFDNTVAGVPYVDNTTMSATWDNASSLRLSWEKPAGLTTAAFPGARFTIQIQTKTGIDNNGDGYPDMLYSATIPVNDAGGDTTLTVPSTVYTYLSSYNASDLAWDVQVRIYRTSPEGYTGEVYRHYSGGSVLPQRPNVLYGSYLQLRTSSDGTQQYMGWGTIDGPMAWNIPFNEGTVSSVSLLDNTGSPIPVAAGYPAKFGGPYWQTVSGGSGSSPAFGFAYLRGFNIKPDVPVGSLAAGVYTLRIVSSAGTFDQQIYYPGDETLPSVSASTMSSAANDDGSVALSWQAPAGFDGTMSFTVVLRSTTQDLYPDIGYDEFLYAGVDYNPASTSYSLTIPKYVADYARSLYAAGQVAWYVQTRKNYLYNGLNANVARSNSATSALPY
jgi:hypothetical protein